MSDPQHVEIDPIERDMKPLELLKYRMNRQNQVLAHLQKVNMDTVTALQKDLSFTLRVVEALEQHLDPEVRTAAMKEATKHLEPANPAPVDMGQYLERGGFDPLPVETKPVAHATSRPTLSEVNKNLLNAMDTLSEAAVSAAKNKPTPTAANVTQKAQARQADASQYLGHFSGTGSVFAKFLSPRVMDGAKGFIEPGYANFQQYNEDALGISAKDMHLNEWPDGFYRDSKTMLQQFVIRTNRMHVTAVNLPRADTNVFVSFAPFNQRLPIQHLSVEQMADVHAIVHSVLLHATKNAERTGQAGQ